MMSDTLYPAFSHVSRYASSIIRHCCSNDNVGGTDDTIMRVDKCFMVLMNVFSSRCSRFFFSVIFFFLILLFISFSQPLLLSELDSSPYVLNASAGLCCPLTQHILLQRYFSRYHPFIITTIFERMDSGFSPASKV